MPWIRNESDRYHGTDLCGDHKQRLSRKRSQTAELVGTGFCSLGDSLAVCDLAHDAHIVALCIEHGVTDLLTADRDFTRFSELKVSNPFAP